MSEFQRWIWDFCVIEKFTPWINKLHQVLRKTKKTGMRFFYLVGLGKGSIKKKKSGIFQIWSETPTHPCNRKKSGKKIKILSC